MNRRSFFATILKAGVSAMILPSALTYNRTWTTTALGLSIPADETIFKPINYHGRWRLIVQKVDGVDEFVLTDNGLALDLPTATEFLRAELNKQAVIIGQRRKPIKLFSNE